jgi:hypothetical protein
LFQAVRDPSGSTPERKYRRWQSARKAEHPSTCRQVKIEIRAKPSALPNPFLDFASRVEPAFAFMLRD